MIITGTKIKTRIFSSNQPSRYRGLIAAHIQTSMKKANKKILYLVTPFIFILTFLNLKIFFYAKKVGRPNRMGRCGTSRGTLYKLWVEFSIILSLLSVDGAYL
jgi:hypothetical protein